MHRTTKSELQMLREVGWLLLPQLACCFCGRPLSYRPLDMTFGHRRHGPVLVKLSVHHKDHVREHNSNDNLALAHKVCHIKYHARVNKGEICRPTSIPEKL